jgi:hypothetical protein
MLRWLTALSLFALGTVGLAASDDQKASDEKQSAKFQIVSLSIFKAPPAKPGVFMARPTGVNMEIMVSLPGRYIAGFDAKGGKLESFADDKGNALYKKAVFGGMNWLNEYFTQFDPDGASVTVQVHGNNPPGKGADKLLLKGSFIVKCGADAKSVDVKELEMKPKQETTAGNFKVRVGQFGNQIEVLSSDENLKKVEFFDDKGKAIMTGPPSRNRLPATKDKAEYVYYYFLIGKHEKISAKIHYFTKMESVTVPLGLKVGMGLE